MKEENKNSNCLTEQTIDGYLNEALSKEDRFVVEDHLLDCPFCTDAVEGFAKHYNFESDTNLEQLDKRFEAKLNMDKETPVRTLIPKRKFSLNNIAAAVLLLLVPLAGWMYWNSGASQNLYASYLPEDMKPQAVVRSNADMQKLGVPVEQAKKLFEEKRFEASLEACEKVLEQIPEHALATYYAGLSALESGHAELARHHLSGLRINHTDFYEDATWYLALTELKAGDLETAKKLLTELTSLPQSIYFAKAKQLKKEIKEE